MVRPFASIFDRISIPRRLPRPAFPLYPRFFAASAPRKLLLAAPLLVSSIMSAGCDDTPVGSSGPPCCDPNGDPIFLQSKLDDDDGDGNPYDEDFPTINDEDDDIADHTWIRDHEGVYHLFFHNEGRDGGNEIEHYTSTDFQRLDYVGLALQTNPGGWDSRGLWAPHVVEHDGTYYMFYTGIDGKGVDPSTKQRIGLATSTDLVTWTRYPVNNCPGTTGDGCIYECNECWTAWSGPPGESNQQCRDPFVIWDPDEQRWVMFTTARSDNRYGVVSVAYSTNLVDWTGAGFIDATRRLDEGAEAQTTGGQAENPYVMTHNGTHYLLFTDWRDPEDSVSVHNPRTIVQYATSSTLTADTLGSANWTYRGYTPDPGVNAIEVQRVGPYMWIMSQSISNERSGYWVRRRQLRIKCVIWKEDFSFETAYPRLPCGLVGR